MKPVLTLNLGFNRITGQLSGKSITASFHAFNGGAIPRGEYLISAPMHNSVYGTFALVSPARPGAGWIDKGWLSAGWINKDWLNKGWLSAGSRQEEGIGRADWIKRGADWVANPGQQNQPGVFILVDKPLAGRHAIVVTRGFAELMAELQRSGGSAITVA